MLVSMLKGPVELEEERLAAIKALYMLSFDETNKEMIKSDRETLALLKNLESSPNKEIQQATAGVMWEIEGKKEHVHSSGNSVKWKIDDHFKDHLHAVGYATVLKSVPCKWIYELFCSFKWLGFSYMGIIALLWVYQPRSQDSLLLCT